MLSSPGRGPTHPHRQWQGVTTHTHRLTIASHRLSKPFTYIRHSIHCLGMFGNVFVLFGKFASNLIYNSGYWLNRILVSGLAGN